jgi:hypothetical protein
MSLITLFSAPKPFTDPRIAVIKANAIASWKRLPDVHVLLIGDEGGLAEAAHRLGVDHIRNVTRNERGTPLISSMTQTARESSESKLLCIDNSDIILMGDFVAAAREVTDLRERFVFLSRRWDLDVWDAINFDKGWEDGLRAKIRAQGNLHRPVGSDFFLFPRACYQDLPDFAVGRAGWDNWMIYKARMEKWPVVDGTASVTVVHQNHDYSHLPGGLPHHTTPESNENIRLAGGEAAIRYSILDATFVLKGGKLSRPPLSLPRFLRRAELLLRAILFFLPDPLIEQVARPRRWKKRFLKGLGRK